jgi:hypothetical protein
LTIICEATGINYLLQPGTAKMEKALRFALKIRQNFTAIYPIQFSITRQVSVESGTKSWHNRNIAAIKKPDRSGFQNLILFFYKTAFNESA